MSYLWVSDLHVKPASSYRKNLLTGDAFYALDQIQAYAIEHKVTAVILGGDIYDTNQPPGESINRMAAFIRCLGAENITVYYIEGNHDRVNRNPYLPERYYSGHRLLDSIGGVPIGDTAITIDGATIRGIDYCPGDKLKEKLAELPECDVVCLHTGFRHILGFEDAYDLTKDDVPAAVKKMVLVGHVHTNNSSTTDKGVIIRSAGSTWVWRVDEADKDHGFLHFATDLPDANPEYVKLDVRKYFDIDCEQDILDTIAEGHVLPPVLSYVRDTMPHLDHAKYGDKVKLVPKSGDADVEEALDMAEEHAADLLDALLAGVPPDQYPQQYAFMKALLDSQEPMEFIREHLKQAGVTFKESA